MKLVSFLLSWLKAPRSPAPAPPPPALSRVLTVCPGWTLGPLKGNVAHLLGPRLRTWEIVVPRLDAPYRESFPSPN